MRNAATVRDDMPFTHAPPDAVPAMRNLVIALAHFKG